jgi:hypothetical protein
MGSAISFIAGQFAGKVFRATLEEVQKAELGRKYARVDRRPLDPPPVILLRLFEIDNPGTPNQEEREIANYEQIQTLGLICQVDLFPAPSTESCWSRGEGSSRGSYFPPSNPPPYSSPHSESIRRYPHTYSEHGPSDTNTIRGPDYHSALSPSLSRQHLRPYESSSAVIYRRGDYAITETSKLTHALVGQKFVQPLLVDYRGRKSLMFAFADIAVKAEGYFLLRYRVFDLFSKAAQQQDLSIQAECYGGTFRVYSTKEFPGLRASTELTKHLVRYGFRLNIRETERKRRKKNDGNSDPDTFWGHGAYEVDEDDSH